MVETNIPPDADSSTPRYVKDAETPAGNSEIPSRVPVKSPKTVSATPGIPKKPLCSSRSEAKQCSQMPHSETHSPILQMASPIAQRHSLPQGASPQNSTGLESTEHGSLGVANLAITSPSSTPQASLLPSKSSGELNASPSNIASPETLYKGPQSRFITVPATKEFKENIEGHQNSTTILSPSSTTSALSSVPSTTSVCNLPTLSSIVTRSAPTSHNHISLPQTHPIHIPSLSPLPRPALAPPGNPFPEVFLVLSPTLEPTISFFPPPTPSPMSSVPGSPTRSQRNAHIAIHSPADPTFSPYVHDMMDIDSMRIEALRSFIGDDYFLHEDEELEERRKEEEEGKKTAGKRKREMEAQREIEERKYREKEGRKEAIKIQQTRKRAPIPNVGGEVAEKRSDFTNTGGNVEMVPA